MTCDTNRHRRLRSLYVSVYPHLRAAVFAAAPSLTATEADELLDRLASRLDDYPGKDRNARRPFTTWSLHWIRRNARLALRVHQLLSSTIDSTVTTRVAGRVHEYNEPVISAEQFAQWVRKTADREAANVAAWSEWFARHQRAVFDGLWEVLRGCHDLGVGDFAPDGTHPVIQELAGDVWWWALEHATELNSSSEVPVHLRLRELAVQFGRNWRTDRLRTRRRDVALDTADELAGDFTSDDLRLLIGEAEEEVESIAA